MSRSELLTDSDRTTRRLKQLIKKPGLARLAVAFWGEGAVRKLGLDQRKGETRILCDLFSGGCNPNEIKKLLKPKTEVRYLKGLHAKLYSTKHGTVVGSSNASANGLGDEDIAMRGNIELNVFFDAPSLQAAAGKWFERHWKDAELNVVDEDVAESARSVWNRHRSGTLLECIAADPDSLRGGRIRVLVYNDEGFDDKEQRSLKAELVPGLFTEFQWRAMDFYDFYLDETDWPIEPATVIMDFHWGSKGARPKFQGAWRIRSNKQWGQLKDGKTRVITCEHVNDIRGLRFPTSEQRRFEDVLKDYLVSKKRWGKDTVANHYSHLDRDLHSLLPDLAFN